MAASVRFSQLDAFYADLEEIKSDPASIRPGITVMTQNSLSTLISTSDMNIPRRKTHVFHSRITWKGWYPVFESRLDYGDNPRYSKTGESISDPADIQPGLRFTNTISIPLAIQFR